MLSLGADNTFEPVSHRHGLNAEPGGINLAGADDDARRNRRNHLSWWHELLALSALRARPPGASPSFHRHRCCFRRYLCETSSLTVPAFCNPGRPHRWRVVGNLLGDEASPGRDAFGGSRGFLCNTVRRAKAARNSDTTTQRKVAVRRFRSAHRG